MSIFISKSHETFKKINNQLEMLLAEQRHQRSDLAMVLRMLNRLLNDTNLQKQVDEYFEDDETSPQTEQDNKNDDSNN